MPFDTILTKRDGAAFVITLNRPDRRNAFSIQMMKEIAQACHEAEQDAAVRAVIITGGTTYFSAGADLNEAMAIKSTADGVAYMTNWETLNNAIERLTKPVIAAIEGFCMTGGWEFVMACDIRIAAENATFALTSSRIGTVPGAGGTQRLPRLIGASRAAELIYCARRISGIEAANLGLVNRALPAAALQTAASQLAAEIAANAPIALRQAKLAMARGMQMELSAALQWEQECYQATIPTHDRQEALAAFREKRRPIFTGE